MFCLSFCHLANKRVHKRSLCRRAVSVCLSVTFALPKRVNTGYLQATPFYTVFQKTRDHIFDDKLK